METLVKATIDIPNDIFTYLSVKAKASGINLKKYIEDLLVKDVEEDLDDERVYRMMAEKHPEGLTPASDEEQEEFRKWLGI